MQKSNYEYIKIFFDHFGIETHSIQDVSYARDIFFEKFQTNISFSEVFKAYRYSDKVFEIYDLNKKEKMRFSNIDELLDEVKLSSNSKLIISMPRNKMRHEVLLKNNILRKDIKNKIGFYPEIRYSPFGKSITMLTVISGFNKNDTDLVRQVATILNNFEPLDENNIFTNKNYHINARNINNYSFSLFGRVNNLEMILTSLRFAGIKISNKIEIHTMEDYYD